MALREVDWRTGAPGKCAKRADHAANSVAARIPGTFRLGQHPMGTKTSPMTGAASASAQRSYLMLVKLSAAMTAICMLSGAAIAQNVRKPTDPQIAHIAYTAGQLDIAAAKQAITKSKNKEVVSFAQDMVRDHEAVNKQALDLVKKLKVTPEDNDTSRALTKQAADKSAELAKLNGAEFDKTYVAIEVAYHKTVNGALETTLIPSASNPELKSLLQTGLKIFQGHQQHAEHVAAELK
jgi:putative membrane protein